MLRTGGAIPRTGSVAPADVAAVVMVLAVMTAAAAAVTGPPHPWGDHGGSDYGPPNPAYGHGIGLDRISSVDVAGRDLSITVEMPSDFGGGQGIITVTATEDETGEAAKGVTFLIGLFHDGEMLFRHYFLADNGILQLRVTPTGDPEIAIDAQRDPVLGAWRGTADGGGAGGPAASVIDVAGPLLDSPGLYTFEIEVRTIDDPANIIEDSGAYRADLSVVETAPFPQKDSEGDDVLFRTKSYFDRISSFAYDPAAGEVALRMPFDWSEGRMSHVPVVHVEVHLPKDFAEFLHPGYVGTANGIGLFKSSVTVDDYTEDDERIVHFVLLQDHLRFIKNEMKKSGQPLPDEIAFVLTPSQEIDFPLDAYTKSEDYLVNLSWDPVAMEPGVETAFVFTIRDGQTGEPLRNSDYTFVIVQGGQEIYRTAGVATVGGNFELFTFGEEQTGPTTIRFENIRNTGQETEFGAVVAPEFGAGTVAALLILGAALLAGTTLLGRGWPRQQRPLFPAAGPS